MKVYRGPNSTPFYDDSHEFVSRVSPSELEDGIRSNALIRFNITKDGIERQAVCTAQFEEDDIIPMIGGLLTRLKVNQDCLAKIKATVGDKTLSEKDKLLAIQAAMSHVK